MCVCLYTENKVGKRRREKEELKTSIYWLKAFVDTVGIHSADLKDKFLFKKYVTFLTVLMYRKAADFQVLLRMIREISVSVNWFGCVPFIPFYVA